MQMQVHHALPGRRPDVHTDVVAVGGISLIQQPTGIVDERQEGGLLGPGRLEERGHVPEGDEEQVAGAHRIEVIAGVGEIVCEEDGGGGNTYSTLFGGMKVERSRISSIKLRECCFKQSQ